MDTGDEARKPGRPRRHPSPRERSAAYLRRAAALGLVRVSVLVPVGREGDVRAIAGAMRKAGQARRESASLPKIDAAYPNAGRAWSTLDDDMLVQAWQGGATGHELTSGLGRAVEEIVRRLVALEEAGSVREARAELEARGRAERRHFMKT